MSELDDYSGMVVLTHRQMLWLYKMLRDFANTVKESVSFKTWDGEPPELALDIVERLALALYALEETKRLNE